MSVHLQRELEQLKQDVYALCALVESQVQSAVRAFLDRDDQAALRVEQRDDEVDRREVEIEEECLKLLALYQPVAIDLRLIVTVLKLNNDLERIGDLAVNIARKAAAFADEVYIDIPFDLDGMWEKTQTMLRDSIDALINLDPRLAADICARDDEVDRLKHHMRTMTEEMIRENPQDVGGLLKLLAVSRSLERIADCATNIAEDVIYMVEGRIVRHRRQNA